MENLAYEYGRKILLSKTGGGYKNFIQHIMNE